MNDEFIKWAKKQLGNDAIIKKERHGDQKEAMAI